jgi:uncharacterized membrane protein
MAYKRLSMTRGNSKTFPVVFKDASGNPYCLKNWTVFFTLKTNYDLADSDASLQKIVTTFSDSTSGTSGSANITLTPSDTKDLTVGEYDFDIAVCTNASLTYTVLKGKLDLEMNVTKSIGTAGTAA